MKCELCEECDIITRALTADPPGGLVKLWEPEQHDTLELKCAFYVDMTAALHAYISGEAFILFTFLFLVHLNAAAQYSALHIDSSKAN